MTSMAAKHRSSNKITLILIYAVLEWTIILLLLVNSLFSYLILRFAAYFGLELPCPWCTKIDHQFHPRDLLCQFHAVEVSSWGFCLTHNTWVRSQNLCPNCLPKNDGKAVQMCAVSDHDFDINVVPDCSMEMEEEDDCSLVFHSKSDEIVSFTDIQWHSDKVTSERHSGFEEVADHGSNGNEADVSIGTDIPDLDITDQDSVHSDHSIDESPSACDRILSDCKKTEEEMELQLQTLSVHGLDNEINDSFDGSVTSELEFSEGVDTIESLKSALRVERKGLQALYVELEQERNASAVAASQTMAMINRLQEEKAAMQMEALQYQRMMEEQSEYDQEALQILNELMVKRERELEGYRKKLEDYEAREKLRASRRSKDGSARSGLSSASCSEESDGVSIDLNLETKEEDGLYGCVAQERDVVVGLEESLADFEDERLSILNRLKVLEERLLSLEDEKDHYFDNVDAMQGFNGELNGHLNGSTLKMMTTNGEFHQKRRIDDNVDPSYLNDINGFDHNGSVHGSCLMHCEKQVALEEEVDHLYERLEALESDCEFLKQCINSLKKGEKGTDLLGEILQHLRDLRSAELRFRDHH